MKIQKAKRFNKTDFPEAPDAFLKILNDQIQRYVTLFQNNITFEDNFRSEIVTLDIDHDTTLPIILNELQEVPQGAILLSTNYFEYAQMVWEPADAERTVNVKIKWDVPPDEEVRVLSHRDLLIQ
jgi:hypothetical protein